MSKRSSGPKERTTTLPILGDSTHNSAFLMVLGGLIIAWSNNESVFMAMLQSLVSGGKHTATIIWHSLRTTQGRLDLISKLAREQIKDEKLLRDINKAIRAFKGHTGTRNYFCHATYHYNSDLQLVGVQGITLSQDGSPVRTQNKPMNAGTANEIGNATVELAKLRVRTH